MWFLNVSSYELLDVNFLITQNEVAETLSCHDVSKLYFLILVVLFYLLYHNILRHRYIFVA